MKKILLITCLIFLIVFTSGCVFNNQKKRISKYIGINVQNCDIEYQKNTHSGFLGDGDYFAKLTCSKKEEKEIKSKWEKLPVTPELYKVLSMRQCDGNGCKDVYERYNIPKIKHGYYYFYDRHSQANDIHNTQKLNERASYNFSVGIYDSDSQILYYYELDT